MRKGGWLGAVALLMAGVASWYYWQTAETAPTALIAKKAPDFVLKDHQGKEHRLSELKGQAVVVHFWAAWCAPCLDEIPKWIEAARASKSSSIRWVAVSLDPNWEEALKVFPAKQVSENMLLLLDSETTVPEKFGTYQYPETYVLNRNHEIVFKLVGAQEWQSEPIQRLLSKAAQ